MCARFLTTQLNCTHPDFTASLLELEPADVKSPHMSELGWAAGTKDPKSKIEAGRGGNNNYRKHELHFKPCDDV